MIRLFKTPIPPKGGIQIYNHAAAIFLHAVFAALTGIISQHINISSIPGIGQGALITIYDFIYIPIFIILSPALLPAIINYLIKIGLAGAMTTAIFSAILSFIYSIIVTFFITGYFSDIDFDGFMEILQFSVHMGIVYGSTLGLVTHCYISFQFKDILFLNGSSILNINYYIIIVICILFFWQLFARIFLI